MFHIRAPYIPNTLRSTGRHRSMVALLVGIVGLTACGGPSTDPGSTAQDTAKAFIASWEANDGARMEQLMKSDILQVWALGGGSSKWLTEKTTAYGAPVKDKGRVLDLKETGNTAQATIAVVYDCKAATCKPAAGLPDWVPAGNTVATLDLDLQKQTDGKWLVGNFTSTSYFQKLAEATQQAVAAPSYTAQAVSQLATQQAYTAQAAAQATAYMVSQQATQMAYQDQQDAQKTNVAATQAAIPTMTPTPVPVHLSAKKAYSVGVGPAIQGWSTDAILYEVLDHYNGGPRFGYNSNAHEYNCGTFGCNNQEPYIDGAGASRQWLFFVASPMKKEVRVIRVADGQITNQDVSAALYRDTFGAGGTPPAPLDIAGYIDSDQAVKIVREHGYRVRQLENMYVYLSTSDRKQYQYKTTEPRWTVFGDDGKAIILNPQTGEVTQNDF